MASVRLDGVRKVYQDDVVAVHDASFEVSDGEFIVLVGPSGCGKSTILRMIAGLEDISGGDLFIGDTRVNGLPPKERNVSMVFQNYALYPHMTVYDNMAFGLKMRGTDADVIEERVREAARILSIEPLLDRKPEALSGGQRQRVAVGRAIVRDPQVFLFDEPLSNLDAKLRVQMRTEIAKLHAKLDATMVYVTHDQTEAMTMGDRIIVLRDGHVQQVDAPLVLYDQPANRFVAGFIGSPSMNLLDGVVEPGSPARFRAVATDPSPQDGEPSPSSAGASGDASFALPLGPEWGGLFDDTTAPDAVTLGVRPEDLYLAGGRAAEGRRAEGPVAEVELVLDVVEPMGNEIILYAHPRGFDETIVARVDPQEVPDVGDPVRLVVDLEKLHFFDAETGTTLAQAPASVESAS
jgi:multiple sugar transport system ATP-binding protein